MSSISSAQETSLSVLTRQRLTKTLHSCKETVDDLDHSLKRLNTLRGHIYEEREKISKHLAAKRSLLSPIRRLNRDVLLIIFSYACDWKFADEKTSSSLDVKHAPWIFLHVCHWWRHIASSSPSLWSTVRLVLSQNSVLPRHALYIVRLQLQLSRNSPLKLLLYCSNESYDAIEDDIITELVKHSSRWNRVYIRVFPLALWELTKRLGNLPELKTLTLNGFRNREFSSDTVFNAPNLASLHLDDACRILPSMFPASTLLQFTGPFHNGAEFRNFISAVPLLEVLEVHGIGEGQHAQSSNTVAPVPVTLHYLRQLSYLPFSETCTGYLTLPALRILNAMQRTPTASAMAAFYNRSHFSLDQLYLSSFRNCIQFPSAAHFFETGAVLNLTRLHVEVDKSSAHDWITALTVTASSCILPNLSELAVQASSCKGSVLVNLDEARRLLDMVHSRLPDRAGVNPSLKTCLKKMDLFIWEPLDVYTDGFRAFRDGGLDMNFHYREVAFPLIESSPRSWLW